MIVGTSATVPVEAWEDPAAQDRLVQALRLRITRELGGTGTREYRNVSYGTVTDEGEFRGQVDGGAEPTHVLVFLELSP